MAELFSVEASTFFGGLAMSIFDSFLKQIVGELSSISVDLGEMFVAWAQRR